MKMERIPRTAKDLMLADVSGTDLSDRPTG
jgi:hypothetical protein